jgi:arylsulfatase I/J
MFWLLLVGAVGSVLAADKPHVLLLVLDDFGWANAGWHRVPGAPGSDEVVTPNLDALVRTGVELNRSYVYQFCSPSRSALQSGRNPVHVNLYNQAIPLHNPQNVESGGMGMARNMTGIAVKMREGGYATHQFGKWGIGCLSPGHTPLGRGYDTSFGYFDHTLDYWSEKAYEQCPTFQTTDLWASDGPAYGVNGSFTCNQSNQDCAFLDSLIVDRLLATIAAHDPAQPLFLYWAPHATHSPLEVPHKYYDRFPFVSNATKPSNFRRLYDALTNFIDEAVGNVTSALRAKGMYDNLLVIMTTVRL